MTTFLKDVTNFLGDGSKNEQGQTLDEFLAHYDVKKYDTPCTTADIVVFKYHGELKQIEQGLSLLLIKRRNHPSIGMWALPGGFAEMKEDLIDSAKRDIIIIIIIILI